MRKGSLHPAHTQGLDAVTVLSEAISCPWSHPHKPVLLPPFYRYENRLREMNSLLLAHWLGVD